MKSYVKTKAFSTTSFSNYSPPFCIFSITCEPPEVVDTLTAKLYESQDYNYLDQLVLKTLKGSVFRPLLSVSNTANISTTKETAFADDTVIMTKYVSLSKVVEKVLVAVKEIYQWTRDWKIQLNSFKLTFFMFKRHWDDEGKNLTVYLHHQVQLYYISLPGYAVSTTVQNDTAVLVHDNNMKVLVTLVAIVAVFASVESGYIGGGHGGGGGGGGYGGGSPGPAGGLETPIIHTGAVVSHVFGPPPPALGLPGPAIPDHGFERYVFHKPSPPLYVKGHH
ncbi:uncharacterized protein LOC143192025 [Rhynchophorus ferrugineus]|uniref:uncharacterized protein LOC143192025 n=1 Tax=Rhynchophorus ferrugineus TaxID=354439 RepID=UPI003FCC8926